MLENKDVFHGGLGGVALLDGAGLSAQAPQGGGRGGRGAAAGQTVEKIRQLKPDLYMITGGGANTLVRVTAEGLIVVDTKNPGDENYNRVMEEIKVGLESAGEVRPQHAPSSRPRRHQSEVHRCGRAGDRARGAEDTHGQRPANERHPGAADA